MTSVTLVGNLAGDPEVRFTASGQAVANFTVCETPRFFDKTKNEWVDGETLFMRCSIWREAAERVAESLHKGDRVIVTGKIKSRTFDTTDGEKRTVVELDADEVGASVRWATVKVSRAGRDRSHAPDPWGTDAPAPSVSAVA